MSRYRLRPVHPFERAMIYEWRNAPPVRRVMRNPNIVDSEVHKDWWQTAIDDPTRRMLILDVENVPKVLVLFFDVKPGASAQWGFYAAPSDKSAANGSAIYTAQAAAIAYAFDHLRIETLCCEACETNRGVLHMLDRFGFKDTGQILEGFVQRSFSRLDYERFRKGPLVVRLSDVAIQADSRDVQVPALEAARPAPERGHRKRVAILGSANWELAARDLGETYLNAVGHLLEVTAPRLDLSDAASPLRRDPADILIFAERFEDLAGAQGEAAGIDEDAARASFSAYMESIRTARGVIPSLFLINNFAPVRPRPQSIAEAVESRDAAARLAGHFSRELLQLAGMESTLLVPLADLVTEAGRRNSDPGKYWFTDRIPFGQALVDRWTSCVAGMIAASGGRTIRAIVCDLNAIWPGNDFLAVQRCLKMLSDRGTLLAVCGSHETPQHPGMILTGDDFSARRINGNPKPENIRSIAIELELPESSIMVLENDPLERARIREALPNVVTPELPWDVADRPRFLTNHPLLTY